MKTIKLLSLLFSISLLNGICQTTKTTSKTIYNLKEGEKLFTQEGFISFTSTGEQYEFVTTLNNEFYLHTKGKDLGPFNGPPVRMAPMKYICRSVNKTTNKFESYYLDLISGAKVGPYESIEFWSFLENKNPTGFYYTKNEKYFVKVLGQPKDFGPYDLVNLLYLGKNRTDFIYKIGPEYFTFQNGKINGPYLDLQLAYTTCPYPIFTYKDKKGQFFASFNNKTFGPFAAYPQFCFSTISNDPKFFIAEPSGVYSGFYLLKDGSKVPGNEPSDLTTLVYNSDPNKWIKLEKTGVITAAKEGKKTNCKRDAPWYFISSEGKKLGPFEMKDEYSGVCQTSDNFIFLVKDPPTGDCNFENGKSTYKNNPASFYFIDKTGILINAEDAPSSMVKIKSGVKSSGALLNNNLYINNRLVKPSGIEDFNFITNSDNWYASCLNSKKDSLSCIGNGKILSVATGSNLKIIEAAVTEKNEFLFVTENSLGSFLHLPNGNSYGPYTSVRLNAPVIISNNGKTVAFIANYSSIIINGEIKGEGTALTKNAKVGTFHWFSADESKISVNTLTP